MNVAAPSVSASAGASSDAVSASAPAIPFLRHDNAALEPGGVGVGNALLVVLAVGALGLWLVRRFAAARRGGAPLGLPQMFGAAAARAVTLVESTRLTPKASAHVLQWKQRQWLVICTDQGTTVVAQDPAGADEPGMGAA